MDRMLAREPDVDGRVPQHRSPSALDEFSWGAMALQSPCPPVATWTEHSTNGSSRDSLTSTLGEGLTAGNDSINMAPISYSTASSYEDSWNSATTDHDDAEREGIWDEWEQDSDSAPILPKTEPVDDDNLAIANFNTTPLTPTEGSHSTTGQKRPRGRPRKNPLQMPANGTKITKGRSKTGCITCRKRKKKCDEGKPGCLNCEKNSVLCEGYNEKQIWKSGKERAEEGRHKHESYPPATLPPILPGVETPEDQIFFRHYVDHFSKVLTVEPEPRNAFKEILLNLATRHQGLLHSLLAVSSMHIDLNTPSFSPQYSDVTKESLRRRSSHHASEARSCLYADFKKSESLDHDDLEYRLILAARYCQMLCLILQNLIEGNPRGEHRVHLQAYQKLIRESPPDNPTLYTFITEFFQYHIYADDLLWHPENSVSRLSMVECGMTPPDGCSPCLLGVQDNLFRYLRDITSLRDTVRKKRTVSTDLPSASYDDLFEANAIGNALQHWTPNWQPEGSRGITGELYRLTLWIYLFRTVYPPAAVASDSLLGCSSAMGFMSERRLSIASSTGYLSNDFCEDAGSLDQGHAFSRVPSRTNSMHEEDGLPTPAPTNGNSSSRPPSPRPSRRPSQDDKRVTLSISDALNILGSFDSSDPCQTLLLIPCLLLGTCCFDAAQHPRIRAAVRAVREYTGLRNADRVQELLDEVWALMDKGDWVAVWDWQIIASRLGLDFLCT